MAEASIADGRAVDDQFRVGHVYARAFAIIAKHAVPLLTIAAIGTLPFVYVDLTLFGPYLNHPGTVLNPYMLGARVGPNPGLGYFLSLFGGSLSAFIFQAALIYMTFQATRGHGVSAGAALWRAVVRFLPILGLVICFGLTLALAAILLVVPAFIAYAMFYVAIPVCVIERLGPIKSMGRSRALTKGHRWQIAGIVLPTVIFFGILNALLPPLLSFGGPVILIGGILVLRAFATIVGAALVTTAYHDLRIAKEGSDTDRMAAVFD